MLKDRSFTLHQKLVVSIVLNLLFTVFEFSMGVLTGSLVLISDAAHNLTDVLNLIISSIGNHISQREPDTHRTFGYGRAQVLAALVNASLLLCFSFLIFHEAYERFFIPHALEGGLVMLIGFCGIIMNGCTAWVLYSHRHDINIRSAFVNILLDALASAGALVAGLVIITTGYTGIDSLIAMCIGTLLLINAYRLISEATHILLEGVPRHINIEEVKRALTTLTGVVHVKQLHIWTISTSYIALSCHLQIDKEDLHKSFEISTEAKKLLREQFNIARSTIEIDIA